MSIKGSKQFRSEITGRNLALKIETRIVLSFYNIVLFFLFIFMLVGGITVCFAKVFYCNTSNLFTPRGKIKIKRAEQRVLILSTVTATDRLYSMAISDTRNCEYQILVIKIASGHLM